MQYNTNLLYHGDNYLLLKEMVHSKGTHKLDQYKGNIKLIYIDPPFASKQHFVSKSGVESYSDVMNDDVFLSFMQDRLLLMRDVLADDGSIYVHLDHRMSHYVKILMDSIFGKKNFRNEIIWHYVSGGVSDRFFARKHDTILFYTKSPSYIFNPQKERRKTYPAHAIQNDEKGEYVWYIKPNTNPKVPKGVKTYIDKYVQDVWSIPIVNPMAKERVDYPTQKPTALLERIIKASTNEGDLVADFFAGSGTTGITAASLKRRWIMSDLGDHAIRIIKNRLKNMHEEYTFYTSQ